jgi:hypothetical protein
MFGLNNFSGNPISQVIYFLYNEVRVGDIYAPSRNSMV